MQVWVINASFIAKRALALGVLRRWRAAVLAIVAGVLVVSAAVGALAVWFRNARVVGSGRVLRNRCVVVFVATVMPAWLCVLPVSCEVGIWSLTCGFSWLLFSEEKIRQNPSAGQGAPWYFSVPVMEGSSCCQ